MGSNPINLGVRLLLEIGALVGYGYWGWTVSDGVLRYLLALAIPLVAAVVWGTFAVLEDPSRSGKAPVPVSGLLRLIIELTFFALASYALFRLYTFLRSHNLVVGAKTKFRLIFTPLLDIANGFLEVENMTPPKNENVQINDLKKFFIITFAISWLIWLPRVLADNNLADIPKSLLSLNSFAVLGPAIAAFWLTYKTGGIEGVKTFWKRGWNFKFDKKWLAVVFLIPVITSGLTILVINILGGKIPWDLAPLPLILAAPIFIVIFLTQALPEEYGWRGFALDRLQSRWNALTASLVLGFLWGLWHLPLHFMNGTTQEVIPVVEFILKQMVGAIFFTWIYNNTNRNVFLAILMHAVWNVFGGLFPYWVTSQGRWANFGVELTLAIIIVVYYGAKTLVRETRQV